MEFQQEVFFINSPWKTTWKTVKERKTIMQGKPSVRRCQHCVKRDHEERGCVCAIGNTMRNTCDKE